SGTPAFVAPELADGTSTLSAAVDVFSFGVVAYGLLTGKSPFIEPPLLARLDGRPIARPPAAATACGQLAPELGRAIDACLSTAAYERPAVDDLIAVFAACYAPSPLAHPRRRAETQ
ncbi:MAG: protein kinase domain-containing protein, partial [Polyangiaceae bacterium]